MNRSVLHISFWVAYVLQDAFLQFVWVAASLPHISDSGQFVMALEAAAVLLLPKIFFSYYFLYRCVPKMVKEKPRLNFIIAETIVIFIAALILYRALFGFFVYPVIYAGLLKGFSFFSVRAILIGIMDIGFVSGTAIAIKLLRIQLKNKEREKNLVKEKLETELKFLRNQINPHFLFNTLNNIYALSRRKSDETPVVVMKLSKLLRFMLYEAGNECIAITDEIKIIEHYLELQKIRYSERLSLSFEKEIDDSSIPIVPLLLLPFVENAFKHGVSETRFDSFVDIRLKTKEGHLDFYIANSKETDGDDEPVTFSESIGLSNIKRQLELTYKDYNLQIDNLKDQFKVQLKVNLHSYAKI